MTWFIHLLRVQKQMQNEKIILIFGDSFYRTEVRNDFLGKIKTKFSLVIYEKPSVEILIRELLSDSLFDDFKVVRVSDFSFKKEMSDFFSAFSNSLSSSILIIEGSDASDGKSISKKIGECTKKDIIKEHFLEKCKKSKDATDFILEYSSKHNMKMDKQLASLVVDLCGQDFSIIYEELKKLGIVFGTDKITKNDILVFISPISQDKSFIDFYVSIMTGDMKDTLVNSRNMTENMGPETVFSCLMKLSELLLIFSYFNGHKESVANFMKKDRSQMSRSKFSNFLKNDMVESVEKQPQVSDFMLRVVEKLYNRLGDKKRAMDLFVKCYDSFRNFRLTANLSLASAQIDEIICVISRR